MANEIKNQDWKMADQVADFLCIDRDVCRRAFYREPEERVREVVRWVLSKQGLPGHDPEQMIERWAREYEAGAYSYCNRRSGSVGPSYPPTSRRYRKPQIVYSTRRYGLSSSCGSRASSLPVLVKPIRHRP